MVVVYIFNNAFNPLITVSEITETIGRAVLIIMGFILFTQLLL